MLKYVGTSILLVHACARKGLHGWPSLLFSSIYARKPRVVYDRFTLCNLGCRLSSRATLWLVCEWWQVRTAVPEGGVDDPLGVAEQLDVVAAAPNLWQCYVLLGGLASSSLFERPVSAPAIAVAASSLLQCW
jgi:hypothetical protein